MEPFIGEIRLFAGDFAPRGWLLCDGKLLAIGRYENLFSLLKFTYGGDGHTAFNLPDLRGRAAVQQGQGPTLSNYALGQQGGAETVTLNQQQLPAHSHALKAVPSDVDSGLPTDNLLSMHIDSETQQPVNTFHTQPTDLTTLAVMNANSIGQTGGGQPVSVLSPVLALNYIIAIEGIYPSRP